METGKHATCLGLVREALNVLQDKKQPTSTALRKLELAARLLGDEELTKWCDFHFGAYYHDLPVASDYKNRADEYAKDLLDAVKKIGLKASWEELTFRCSEGAGGFCSIEVVEGIISRLEKEKRPNDGTHYRITMSKAVAACANAAASRSAKLYAALAFGDIPRRQFDIIRERVDSLLLDICPEAIEKFMSAYQMLGSKSGEDWSLALTECRRVIKAVADSLFPATDQTRNNRKLGEDQYINRLWAFLDDNADAGSDKDLAKAHIDYLGTFMQRLNDKASKGVHASVSYEEAVRAVLYTYLTLGDIIEFTAGGLKSALSQKGMVDINTASITEMTKIPGITGATAKEIVKRRVVKPFASIDELLEIKGIGRKLLEQLRHKLIAIPAKD